MSNLQTSPFAALVALIHPEDDITKAAKKCGLNMRVLLTHFSKYPGWNPIENKQRWCVDAAKSLVKLGLMEADNHNQFRITFFGKEVVQEWHHPR